MSDFETRKRPLRDTVCDIDADIINLIMRRHNMLTRMAGRKKNPGSQDEKMIREDFLQQNAFVETDSYASLDKQFALVELIFYFRERAAEALKKGADIDKLSALPAREAIGRAKDTAEENFKAVYADIRAQIDREISAL